MKHLIITLLLIMVTIPSCGFAMQKKLDISQYFNNDGISTHDAQELGALDKGGYSLPAEGFPDNRELRIDGIPFSLPDPLASKNNISCRSQKIVFPDGRFSRIHVLATAVSGSYIDELKVICANNTSYDMDIAVSDWCVTANYNEKPALKFDHRHGQSGNQIPCTIWMQTMYLRKTDSPARSVVLPNNPNLHIFAITLE